MNDKLENIINSCPYTTEFSKFEQENFLSPARPGYPRYIIGLINRYRKLVSDIDQEDRTFEKSCLLEEKAKIENILSEQDLDILQNAVENWEQVEAEYWADTLGKIAAIEILTYGKTTYDTMLKMAKLPEDLYINATQICVRLANKIKETTIMAEQQIGIGTELPEYFTEQSPAPKKLFLKKTK